MNTVWSDNIQNIGVLYTSRTLRFADSFKNKYTDFFDIDKKKRILEIGCGPGALCESLSRWYPHSEITGIDRDSAFIDFAKKNSPRINYLEADATALPFEDNSFDVTVSNTVAEHIEPSAFFGEQYRVLDKGGVCIVLSARKGIHITSECVSENTDFEKEIWARTEKYFNESFKKHGVCAYPMSESEYPSVMEKHGFRNVCTEYITVNLTPDNPSVPREMAIAMINSERQNDIDAAGSIRFVAPGVVSEDEIQELQRLINKKYDKRISLYDKGVKLWDTTVSVTMMIRGEK